MYLKSLVLKGFKSFADRSVLKLEPGMTVVVGPNGSGKSNVSDAVLWVLGEQSAKQLRGQAMEDVIFAGSSARAAVGLAEVDLVLDNTDGTLPLDFNEVVITRRMYRSGESEYLINGSPSRLMDILDVLNDSGLGRDNHSIISQGSLQSLLQARPEDRRVLIEEAAGILKHKKRKERASRKLKNMDAELARVNDIAAEIDRQLKPLERQASRAQQFETLSTELKDIELTLAVDDLRRLQKQWDSVELAEKEGDAAVELARFKLEEKNAELEKLQRLLEEKGLFVGDLAEQRRRCQMVKQQLESALVLLGEKGRNMASRLNELHQIIARAEATVAESAERLEQLESERVESDARRDALKAQLSDLSVQTEAVRKERIGLDEQVGKCNANLRKCNTSIDEAKLKGLKATESLSTADVQRDMLKRRAQQIEESFASTQNTLGTRRGRLEEIEKELTKLKRNSDLAKSDIDKRVRLLDTARKELDAKREKLNDVRAELKALEEVDRAFDAASPLLSWVIEHKDEMDGIVTPLSEIFTAPQDLEALVEQLLGADLFGMMIEDDKAASELVERILKCDIERGEISLVMRKDSAAATRTKAKSGLHLLDKLTFDKAYAHAADVLLGDVYVVDDVRQALKAAQQDTTNSRFVTRNGIVVWPSGKITFGTQTADAEGVLARKRRMNALTDAIPAAEEAVSAAEAAMAQAQSNLQVAQADDFEISQSIAQVSGEEDSLRQEIGRLEQSITSQLQEKTQIEGRLQKVDEDTAQARENVEQFKQQEEQLVSEKAQIEEEMAVTREKRSKLFESENALSGQISAAQVELAAVREREIHIKRQIDTLKADAKRSEQSLETSRSNEHKLNVVQLRIEPLRTTLNELHALVCEKADFLQDRAQIEQAGQGSLRDTIEAARKEVAAEQAKLNAANEELTKVRIEKGGLQVRVESAVQTITEQSGVLLDIALETPEPENREELEERANKLKGRIQRLGNVNPIAVEEYRKLKERRDFIAVQVDDLEGAAKALERIVAAIDRKLRNRFVETFDTVNGYFEEIFSELFPGGTGHLEMTDVDNPESTGIEVHAQPRGKAVRKQSLLSGGEQSLVALALMFAVYRVRHTPFYILDEVEAALDDTNLRRLLSYLDSIRTETQVIMISHQRRTMEMADLLYGVSMRSDGVSKLVSQRLDQAVRQAQNATPAVDVETFSAAE